jgi:hypothetical protein
VSAEGRTSYISQQRPAQSFVVSVDLSVQRINSSTLPGATFTTAYGGYQIGMYRWVFMPTLDDESSKMSFGQVVPLLLLLLPVFAAVEAIEGE